MSRVAENITKFKKALHQKQGLESPGEMEDSVGGGQHCTARAREGKADKIVSGNCQGSFFVRSDLNDPALAAQRSSDIEISGSIEGQSLGPAQTAVERCDRTVGVNGIDSIVT